MKMQHMTKQNLQLEVTLRTRINFFFRGLFIRGFYPGTLKHAPKVHQAVYLGRRDSEGQGEGGPEPAAPQGMVAYS